MALTLLISVAGLELSAGVMGRGGPYVGDEPTSDETGSILGYAKIARDITERKEFEEKLIKTREALHQSQKMEAIGHLTGGIAHDFNNLLMAVLSSLELMRKRLPNDARLKALLNNAVSGAERGAVLTPRMLAFARRQGGSTLHGRADDREILRYQPVR